VRTIRKRFRHASDEEFDWCAALVFDACGFTGVPSAVAIETGHGAAVAGGQDLA
jgi:hypothetical protein